MKLGQIGSSVSEGDAIGSFVQGKVSELKACKPYSWFYDQTHDNPCQIERRSVEDVLPRSSIVTMSICSNGSNRGYDELVPHHIDVVHERRFYPQWSYNQTQTNEKTGMISLKKSLNQLHIKLAVEGYTQLMVDQLSSSVLLLIRHNPINHKSILLIAHTSFNPPTDKWPQLSPLSIQGLIDEIVLAGSLNHPRDKESVKDFVRSKEYINGLTQTQIYLNENLSIEQSKCIRLTSPSSKDYNGFRTIEFTEGFRPGSIVVLSVSLLPLMNGSLIQIQNLIKEYSNPESEFNQIVKQLTLVHLERVLYRSSIEEQSDEKGFDVYEIPDYGKLLYCGLHGQITVLDKVRYSNDLKHPLVNNLKQGN
jgi:glycogen debranching enzyme